MATPNLSRIKERKPQDLYALITIATGASGTAAAAMYSTFGNPYSFSFMVSIIMIFALWSISAFVAITARHIVGAIQKDTTTPQQELDLLPLIVFAITLLPLAIPSLTLTVVLIPVITALCTLLALYSGNKA